MKRDLKYLDKGTPTKLVAKNYFSNLEKRMWEKQWTQN